MALLGSTLIWLAGSAQGGVKDPPDLNQEQQDQLNYHTHGLQDEQNTAPNRRFAAEELLDLNFQQAFDVLDQALRSGDRVIRNAVIDALERERQPPVALLDATVAALAKAEPASIDTIAGILTRFGPDGLSAITTRVLDAGGDADLRVRLTRSLGMNRSAAVAQGIVDTLLQLVDPGRNEPIAVQQAAFRGLNQLTNVPFGENYQAWSSWWERNRDTPVESWLSEAFQATTSELDTLRTRLRILETQKIDLLGLNARLQARLIAALDQTYGLFVSDDNDDEAARQAREDDKLAVLSDWMDDTLPDVRRYALARVESLDRNGDRISDGVKNALAMRLKDDEPDLRRSAAQLLDNIDDPRTASLITAALRGETDDAVVIAYLDVLTRRPSGEAVSVIQPMLAVENRREAAASAMLAIASADLIAEADRAAVQQAVREAFGQPKSAPLVRLHGLIGTDEDIAQFGTLLDDPSPEIRRAAAESMRSRRAGDDVILSHAGDPVVYPSAVDVVASGPNDAAAFERLLALTPPDEPSEQIWRSGMQRLAARLAPPLLIAADDRLRQLPDSPLDATQLLQLRASVLAPVAATPPDRLTPDHVALLTRLAEVRTALNEPENVLAALDLINGAATDANHARLRFDALVALGRFEDAAGVLPEAQAWIVALTRLIDGGSGHARALGEEIKRRFPEMNGPLKAEFEAALARIDPPSGGDTQGGGGSDGAVPNEVAEDGGA